MSPANQAPAAALLGYAPMDAVHAEFERLVTAARNCPDDALHDALLRLHAHLLAHFGQEDGWMRDSGFPAVDCHAAEHAAVLRSSGDVLPRVAAGDHALGRAFAAELDRWFPGHADYLDSALAAWLCKRRYGGRPVVVHRRTAGRTAPEQAPRPV